MANLRRSGLLARSVIPIVLVAGALVGPAGVAESASAGPFMQVGVQGTGNEQVARGVEFSSFVVSTAHGKAAVYLVTADLRDPNVGLNLLHPDAVAQSEQVSRMMLAQQAVAGTNGDFFNISETHAGVPPTFSSDGPEVADGIALKANVPDGQGFGPALPPGTTTGDVFGMGADRRMRVSTLDLVGQVHSRLGSFDLAGLNQFALRVNGIGVYTPDWGTVSRLRATCGNDTNRSAPCSADTEEVVVHHGVVTSVAPQPGAGAIPPDTEVLVGRESGADQLRALVPGDHVAVNYRLSTDDVPPFTFAVGGFPILRGGTPLAGLDSETRAGDDFPSAHGDQPGAGVPQDSVELAPRTSAGTSADGRTAYLVTVDGREAGSVGMTVSELAGLMRSFGATDAVNLDGGGSSELATRQPGSQQVIVRNIPSDGAERPVANGIGVFLRQ